MNYTAKLYVADRKTNLYMECFGLKPENKVFIQGIININFKSKNLNESIFYNIIKKSKNEECWFPVIEFGDQFYFDPSINQISDGVTNLILKNPKIDKEEENLVNINFPKNKERKLKVKRSKDECKRNT